MRRLLLAAGLVSALTCAPAVAQTQTQSGGEQQAAPPGQTGDRVVIDILAPERPAEPLNAADLKACEEERDAAQLSQEIIVCGERSGDPDNWFSGGREAWLKRYAERTRNINTIPAPDVAGDGIFRGPPTVGGLCVIPPCPEPPALLIDVQALPGAPVDSDADRIARGLPPQGRDGEPGEDPRRISEAELGLPPRPDFANDE